jgi:hypothetical protein
MPIVHGDTVIPAGSFNGEAKVANLSVGSLCPDGLLMGTYSGDGDDNDISWNSGYNSADVAAASPSLLRKVTAYTGTDMLGKTVKLAGAATAFIGTVVQQFNTELDNTGGDGAQVPCLLIKASQFYYVAEPASVEEV